jgi:hypothetical protein
MRSSTIIMTVAGWLLTLISSAWSQTPLSFYPYAQGNVWKYRDASTQEVLYTRYNDTVWMSADSSINIRARYSSGPIIQERIDSSFKLFNMTYQPNYPRYILGADSGVSWIAGFRPPADTTRVTVTSIYQGYVFGVPTTVKVFTFVIHRPPPWQPFWLGDDHLAVGFGLVFAFIEGGSAPYLSGAIINGVHWGEPIVEVKEIPNKAVQFVLHQNYPNPFNPVTTIEYELPSPTVVELTVFDVLGRVLSVLEDGHQHAGRHVVHFDATGTPSGVLFYQLKAGTFTQTKRMMIIR